MFLIGPFCTLTNSSKKFEVETFSCRIIDQSYMENSNRVKKTKKSRTSFFHARKFATKKNLTAVLRQKVSTL